MINYRWQCLACESGNDPNEQYCQTCGCPIDVDSGIAEGWGRALRGSPEKPSNIGHIASRGIMGFQHTRTSPCPNCGSHMYISDSTCPHCNYELSLEQRYQVISSYGEVKSYGYQLGFKFFPTFILIAAVIIYVVKNF